MENALLIGLSRQMTLERQIDVIANNVANVNTNGFKADQSLFEEYLNSGAHEDNFVGRDRRVSYVQDRGTFRDLDAGADRADQQPARRRDRRRRPSSRCRRKAASATPATAICRSTAPASSSPPPAIPCSAPAARSCSSRPTTTSTSPPTAPSRCWRAPAAPIRSAASFASSSFADAQKLMKQGANLYVRPRPAPPQADTKSTVQQGYVEKSNVNSVAEMSRMVEVMRSYTADRQPAAAAERPAQDRRSKSSPTFRPEA